MKKSPNTKILKQEIESLKNIIKKKEYKRGSLVEQIKNFTLSSNKVNDKLKEIEEIDHDIKIAESELTKIRKKLE